MDSIINKKYLRSVIFGGTDGIITIFNIISGIEGAKLKSSVVLVIGLAALISDAVSMGFSDYLSLNAENKVKNDKTIDPKISGLVTFSSFALFGLIPLVSYILSLKYSKNNKFLKTYISTIASLFILGSIQSKFTQEKWYSSGFYISLYGLIASLISYNIGKYLKDIFV